MTVPVSLATLTTPTTADEALQLELGFCIAFGLPTTAWQSVHMVPTILNVNATLAADLSSEVALVAQGGYASTAAEMTDANGNPITTWMQLRATDQYGITPQPSTFASGPVPYTNTSATTYSYSPNSPLHAQNQATGSDYTSVGTGSVAPGSGNVSFQADVAGSASTSGTGVVLVLTTPLNGVTLGPLAASIVGSDTETNQALLTRGQNKLATLAPIQSTDIPGPIAGGADGAYAYVATSIPQAGAASTIPPYAVTSVITGCVPITFPSSGVVNVVIRNAGGAPSAGDIAAVQAAIQALVVPDAVTVTTIAATDVFVLITGTIYISKSVPVTGAQAITNVLDALANYFASVPIGGYTTSTANIVPFTDILSTIHDANAGTVDAQLSSPAGNVMLGTTGVPAISPSSAFAVVFV